MNSERRPTMTNGTRKTLSGSCSTATARGWPRRWPRRRGKSTCRGCACSPSAGSSCAGFSTGWGSATSKPPFANSEPRRTTRTRPNVRTGSIAPARGSSTMPATSSSATSLSSRIPHRSGFARSFSSACGSATSRYATSSACGASFGAWRSASRAAMPGGASTARTAGSTRAAPFAPTSRTTASRSGSRGGTRGSSARRWSRSAT